MNKLQEWQEKWDKYIQKEKLKELLLYPKDVAQLLSKIKYKSVYIYSSGDIAIECEIEGKTFEFHIKEGVYSKLVYYGFIHEGQKVIDKLFKEFPFKEMAEEVVKEIYEEKYKNVEIEEVFVGHDGKVRLRLSNGEYFQRT